MDYRNIPPVIKQEYFKWDRMVDGCDNATVHLKMEAFESISNVIREMPEGESILETLLKWKILGEFIDKTRRS